VWLMLVLYSSVLQFKRCENLPTKKQLQATIARLLKQPATRIATGNMHSLTWKDPGDSDAACCFKISTADW
jgi:hypothetical protein